jgi:multidrug efflux pump subunit AcrA (membrane-fusion protein)
MSQATSPSKPNAPPKSPRPQAKLWLVVSVLIILVVVAGAFYRQWLPTMQRLLAGNSPQAVGNAAEKGHDKHAGHDHMGHDHAGHDEANSIEMSQQARKNIGLTVAKVELQTFVKTISVPGTIVERPGLSTVEVTAPLTGIITRIYIIEGEAITPGEKLFELRLTHEELVQSQADLLQTAEELDVTALEIERIKKLTESGGLAGKQLLERQYEQQKQEAVLRSKRQALLLHGLNGEQVDNILKQRQLLKMLTVYAPVAPDEESAASMATVFQVQKLQAAQGRQVTAGETLAILADHAELYVEGEAFERDVPQINRAAEKRAPISGVLESEESQPDLITGLHILYLATKVNADTRTLDFYVSLPNRKLRDTQNAGSHRFISWKFRPGQRMQLRVPIETLPNRIVLPVDALAQEGVETYIFTPNGDHFDRRNVHVEYRDTRSVVIANDGSLFPGDLVATSSAQQLQYVLKNKSSGPIDPHAGHNH